MFSSIGGLSTQWMSAAPLLLVVTIKNVCGHCWMFAGGQKSPQGSMITGRNTEYMGTGSGDGARGLCRHCGIGIGHQLEAWVVVGTVRPRRGDQKIRSLGE